MSFLSDCPYCNKKINLIVIPYSHEYRLYGYRFFCDCRNDEKDLRDDEESAYKAYLKERQKIHKE